jgi:rhodanese-related sulfurtransferase
MKMLMPKRLLAAVAAVLALLAAATGSSRRVPEAMIDAKQLAGEIQREDDHVTALELAQWIRDRKPGLRVLDVRTDSEFAAFHVPSAERMPLESLVTLRPAAGETLVIYSEGGTHAAQGWVLLRSRGHEHVYFLRGGLLDWMDDVMSPTVQSTSDSASAHVASLSRYFGGVPRVGVAPSAPAAHATATRDTATAAAAVARLRRRGC